MWFCSLSDHISYCVVEKIMLKYGLENIVNSIMWENPPIEYVNQNQSLVKGVITGRNFHL